MSINLTIIPSSLQPNPCYTGPLAEQQRWNDYCAHGQIALPINFTTVIVSSTAPGPDDRDKLWVRVDGSNAILDILTFSNGSWNGLPKPWELGELKIYDPSLNSPISPWFPCDGSVVGVPDLRGRSFIFNGQRILVAGSTDANTNFVAGTSGGEERHTLIAAEIPPVPVNGTGSNTENFISFNFETTNGGGLQGPGNVGRGGTANTAGGGGSHNNIHPYYVAAVKQWRPDLV